MPATTEPNPEAAPPAVVTGAGGWLGQNLVRSLRAEGRRVRALVLSEAEATLLAILGPEIEPVVGDVRDPVAADRLFDGVGPVTVFHAAAIIHPQKAVRELFDVNVGGTQMILDRARRAGATRFVHVSSNSPFGVNPGPDHRFTEDDPYQPYLGYGKSKMEAEQLVARAHERGDVTSVVIRAPWFYGPHQPERQTRFLAAVRRGRFPLVAPGTQRRSMVFTGNLVDGLLRAEATPAAAGRSYWIADAEPYPLADIFIGVRSALAAEGFSVSSRQPRIPSAAARLAERADTLLQGMGRYVQPVHVLGELGHTIACDIGRAAEELGYRPAVSLVEGMGASIRWCQERGDRL